jgi:hypothetical protein
MAVPRRISKLKPQSAPASEPARVLRMPDPVMDESNSQPRVRDEDDDLEDEIAEFSQTAEASVPDRREVDKLTERIFTSVLSRYGWEQHGNRIEHVGEEDRRR